MICVDGCTHVAGHVRLHCVEEDEHEYTTHHLSQKHQGYHSAKLEQKRVNANLTIIAETVASYSVKDTIIE